MNALTDYRLEIDRIDDAIVALLGQRFAICRQVATYKRQNGVAVRLPERIAEVKARCAAHAAALGVDPQFVQDLYAQIIEQTCRTEESHIAGMEAVSSSDTV